MNIFVLCTIHLYCLMTLPFVMNMIGPSGQISNCKITFGYISWCLNILNLIWTWTWRQLNLILCSWNVTGSCKQLVFFESTRKLFTNSLIILAANNTIREAFLSIYGGVTHSSNTRTKKGNLIIASVHFYMGELQGTMKQLAFNHALCHLLQCWACTVDLDFGSRQQKTWRSRDFFVQPSEI